MTVMPVVGTRIRFYGKDEHQNRSDRERFQHGVTPQTLIAGGTSAPPTATDPDSSGMTAIRPPQNERQGGQEAPLKPVLACRISPSSKVRGRSWKAFATRRICASICRT